MSTISQQQYPMVSLGDMQAANPMYTDASETPSYSSLGVIDDMLSTPAQLDWVCYDFGAVHSRNKLTLRIPIFLASV
jgi:hypothetical protein